MTAHVTPPPSDQQPTGRPALNRAARRARRRGSDPALPAGLPTAHRRAVSTKPVHQRTDYAARRSG